MSPADVAAFVTILLVAGGIASVIARWGKSREK